MKVCLLALGGLLLYSPFAKASPGYSPHETGNHWLQNRTITGKVTNESGDGLANVTIQVKGQQRSFLSADLKRWNIAHIKLPTLSTPAAKPLVFAPNNYVLPFSQSELDNNPQLVQNPGY